MNTRDDRTGRPAGSGPAERQGGLFDPSTPGSNTRGRDTPGRETSGARDRVAAVAAHAAAPVVTVSEFTRTVKALLAAAYPTVRVTGEITGISRPPSGIVYFTLKDAGAQLRCVMFSRAAAACRVRLENGLSCEVRGSITLYEQRGEYQLQAEQVVPLGAGAVQAALAQLTKRLLDEGLFAPERKRALPAYPHRIGLVTSPTGAAVRDMIRILHARMPSVEIVVVPVMTQGAAAAPWIAAGIDRANRYGRFDVLVVGRGGGSPEDLWAFNEEVVVRAIARSRTPTISAVGHERDTALTDHVADARAATPSAAAQMAVRSAADVRTELARHAHRAEAAVTRHSRTLRRAIGVLTERYGFRQPRDLLRQRAQHVDELHASLVRSAARHAARDRDRVRRLVTRLRLAGPHACAVEPSREKVAYRRDAMMRASRAALGDRRAAIARAAASLDALGPERVLGRGYALVWRGDAPRLASAASAIAPDDPLRVVFHDGSVEGIARRVLPGRSPLLGPAPSADDDARSQGGST